MTCINSTLKVAAFTSKHSSTVVFFRIRCIGIRHDMRDSRPAGRYNIIGNNFTGAFLLSSIDVHSISHKRWRCKPVWRLCSSLPVSRAQHYGRLNNYKVIATTIIVVGRQCKWTMSVVSASLTALLVRTCRQSHLPICLSVCLTGGCTVAKRLIGSGCRLGGEWGWSY